MDITSVKTFILVDTVDELPAVRWQYQPSHPGRQYQSDITDALPGVRVLDADERWRRDGRTLFVTEEVPGADGMRRRWHLLRSGDFLFQDERTGVTVAARVRH